MTTTILQQGDRPSTTSPTKGWSAARSAEWPGSPEALRRRAAERRNRRLGTAAESSEDDKRIPRVSDSTPAQGLCSRPRTSSSSDGNRDPRKSGFHGPPGRRAQRCARRLRARGRAISSAPRRQPPHKRPARDRSAADPQGVTDAIGMSISAPVPARRARSVACGFAGAERRETARVRG